MGSFIARQPNGLLCRFSSIVDAPTHWDMTEEEYIEMCAERGREEARDVIKNHLKPFDWVTDRTVVGDNITASEYEQFLREATGDDDE